MLTYEALIGKLDAQVDGLLPRQVLDRSRPDYGGFLSEGTAGGTNIGTVSLLGYAYLLEGGRHYRSGEVLERILAGAEFGRHIRRPSGCFDLITTNFDSAPDTGFQVQTISPVVKAARRAAAGGDAGAGEIAEALGEIVRTAVPGMTAGGFHTPNHRWVLVSALSQARTLFPDVDAMGTIEAYLAETVDINADGEYTERSTGVYNAVCNRSLRIAAVELDRPELLAPVRKNLDLSYHLLHADGAVVTSISRRQDRGQDVVPVGLADSYYTLARMDRNGFYAAVADWLFGLQPGGLPWTLHALLEHPEWREDDLRREPLPDDYSKVYATSGLWRVRRGKMSATAASGITAPFSLRHGQADLSAVKLCASYFAISQFSGEDLRAEDGKIQLTHPGRGRHHDGPVYYQPLGEPVDQQRWQETRMQRDVYVLPPLEIGLTVAEVKDGFDLQIATSKGLDGVPFQIACDFGPGGELDLDSGAVLGVAGQTTFLKSGYAVYHVGNDAISIGPGAHAHRMWHMRGSEGVSDAFRVLITLVTPVDRALEIRYGTWSAATQTVL